MANLMPSLSSLRVHLNQFLDLSGASEIVLFERTTFLVISSVTRDGHPRREDGGGGEVAEGAKEWDDRRFERISTMVKAFKLGCSCVSFAERISKAPQLIEVHLFSAKFARRSRHSRSRRSITPQFSTRCRPKLTFSSSPTGTSVSRASTSHPLLILP